MQYMKIEGPETLRFSDRTQVTSPLLYLAWQAEQIQSRQLARVWETKREVFARVNHGRWVAICLTCESAMLTRPDWKLACCAECGAVYKQVRFPEDVKEIEFLLCRRPIRRTQNWEPFETVVSLRLENRAHGI